MIRTDHGRNGFTRWPSFRYHCHVFKTLSTPSPLLMKCFLKCCLREVHYLNLLTTYTIFKIDINIQTSLCRLSLRPGDVVNIFSSVTTTHPERSSFVWTITLLPTRVKVYRTHTYSEILIINIVSVSDCYLCQQTFKRHSKESSVFYFIFVILFQPFSCSNP